VDPEVFHFDPGIPRDPHLVICAGRIEGIKNQMTLIKALNDTKYKLVIIGSAAPNQLVYFNECKKSAARNIIFIDQLPQEELVRWYQQAKVHILPSWFETCGLSSLEAAAMGCNIVITDRGYTREYFEDYAVYCDPDDPQSIFNAVEKAASADFNELLQQRILDRYTWQKACDCTLKGYKQVIA